MCNGQQVGACTRVVFLDATPAHHAQHHWLRCSHQCLREEWAVGACPVLLDSVLQICLEHVVFGCRATISIFDKCVRWITFMSSISLHPEWGAITGKDSRGYVLNVGLESMWVGAETRYQILVEYAGLISCFADVFALLESPR